VENVALHYAEEGELARVKTELEEEKIKNADLDSKNTDLTAEIPFAKTKSELASPPPCEDRDLWRGSAPGIGPRRSDWQPV
jgi:hypothetical protein